MTLTQAQLIVRNAEAYERHLAREASIFILSKLGAPQSDVNDAIGWLARNA